MFFFFNHVCVTVIYSGIECLFQVFDDICLIFQSHGEPDQRVADPQDLPLVFWHRCMRHDCPEKEQEHES